MPRRRLRLPTCCDSHDLSGAWSRLRRAPGLATGNPHARPIRPLSAAPALPNTLGKAWCLETLVSGPYGGVVVAGIGLELTQPLPSAYLCPAPEYCDSHSIWVAARL